MNQLYALHLILLAGIILGSAAQAQIPIYPREVWQQRLHPLESAEHTPSLVYIENRGQWDPRARFLTRLNGLDMWVGADGIVYDLYRLEEAKNRSDRRGIAREPEPAPERPVRNGHVVRMKFVGADRDARVAGTDQLPGVHNYFLGQDPARWATDVPLYAGARILGLYNGIDAVVYADHDLPRYDLVVAPGASPSALRIQYEGARNVRVDAAGDLVITTSVGQMRQQGLFAYQTIDGRRSQVRCSFRKLPEGTITFDVGNYDRSRPLVIDPVVYSTLIAPDGYARGFDVALDATDNAYLTGYTGSASYPTSLGAYQGSLSGLSIDAFVTKISNDGKTLLYSTYLGGASDDVGLGITTDAAGMVYVVGYSYSSNFPVKSAVDSTFAGRRDAFVTKLDQYGTSPAQQLVYSTYLGGTTGDFAAAVVARNGDAYVVGYTDSPTFNVVNAYQSAPVYIGTNPSGEAFVSHLSSNGTILIGSTYLGGDSADIGRAITLDATGNVWVTGTTYSSTFPVDGIVLAYDDTSNGGADAFIAKLTPNMNTLLYGTYLGGPGDNTPSGIALDGNGNVYVTGSTVAGFPTTGAAFQKTYNGGISDMFIAKLEPTGASLLFSTYVGGNNDDWSNDIAVDAEGNAWIAGMSVGGTFPFTTNAIQPFRNGTTFDIAIVGVNTTGNRQIYGSYYGGTGGDSARAIAVASDGTLVLTGSTYSNNFPTTAGSYRPTAPLGAYLLRLGIMRVNAPVGQEEYCGGGYIDIEWAGSANANYDVYLSADSGRTFTPIAFSVAGKTYTWFIPKAQAAGQNYRIKVAAVAGSEADMSGVFSIYTPPRITNQPFSQTVSPGGNASFTATAVADPLPVVRWQKKTGNTWTDLVSETRPVLQLTNVTADMNGTYYRAVFTNHCSSTYSDSARLTVPSITLVSPDGGEAFCAGDTVSIEWQATASGSGVNIAVSSDGGLSWNPIAQNVTRQPPYRWKIPAAYAGSNYQIRVELGDLLTSDGSATSFTVNTAPRVTKDPQNFDGFRGGSASFSAGGTGSPSPSIRWQVDNGTGWQDIPNGAGGTLSLTSLNIDQNGYHYRAVLTNTCGADTTEAATLRVTVEGEGGVEDAREAALALGMSLQPNPASSETAILFTLPRAGLVSVRLLDLHGRIVADIAGEVLAEGRHRLPVSLAGLPSGTYVVELAAGGVRAALKLTLAR